MIVSFFKKKLFLSKFRLIWIAIILLLVGIFLFLKIVPFGRVTYVKDYSDSFKLGKGFVNNFTPLDKVDRESGPFPRLISSPVYFSVFTPRTFSRAKLIVKYKEHLFSDETIGEAGVLINPATADYNLQPWRVENQELATVDFNLKGAFRTKGKYIFTISVPSLETNDNYSNYLEISEVKLEFSGRTLSQKIFGLQD